MIVYHVTTTWVPGGGWFVIANSEDEALDYVKDQETSGGKFAESLYVESYVMIDGVKHTQIIGEYECD